MGIEQPPDRNKKFERPKITCPKCNGTGKRVYPGNRTSTCQTCKGSGKIPG